MLRDARPARSDRVRARTTSTRARSALFADAVARRGRPAADGDDGVRSLAVALAVREAAQTGRAVRVDYEGF